MRASDLGFSRWTDASARTAAYLTWPDTRLRAYLRSKGVDEKTLPKTRDALLSMFPLLFFAIQCSLVRLADETRLRWVEARTTADSIYAKIKEIVNSGIYKAEDVLYQIMALLGAGWEETKHDAKYATNEAKLRAQRSAHHASDYASDKAEDLKHAAQDTAEDWKGHAAETVEAARERAAEAARAAGRSAENVKDNAYKKAGEKVKVAGQKVESTGKKMEGEL